MTRPVIVVKNPTGWNASLSRNSRLTNAQKTVSSNSARRVYDYQVGIFAVVGVYI